MSGAKDLVDAGVNAITMADNSLAQMRISNFALGIKLKQELGVRPIVHIACRDRNLIGTQSHLMGLHTLGIDHALVITGDPAKVGDMPGSNSVYDLTSFELIRMMKRMNEGYAHNGRPLKIPSQFTIGAALDPNVKYLEKTIERMEKKIEAGAQFFMTQPIYDIELVDKLYEYTRHLSVPIFVGVMPLISDRNAQFLHYEVPGIRIPEYIRDQFKGLEGEKGREKGVEITKEIVSRIQQKFNGIYIMTPMTFSQMSVDLIKHIRNE